MYVTPAGADTKTGADWAHAMGEAEFEADLEAGAEAGDIYYIKAGTYTLDSAYDSSARAGTAVAPVSIIGVKAATTNEPPVFADWGTWEVGHAADDCPLISCGANACTFGGYYKIYNCYFTTTSVAGIQVGAGSVLLNCAIYNSSPTGGRYGMNGGSSISIGCELISTNGYAGYIVKALYSYIHDSSTGIYIGGGQANYTFNVIDTCVTGINLVSVDYATILNNTFYGVTTAVSSSDGYGTVAINNIIDTCSGDGFKWTTQTDSNIFAYNHGNDTRNTDQWDGVAVTMPHGELGGGSAGATSAYSGGDPKFTGAAGGDLSLASDSPCIDAGMTITLGVG